MMTTIITTMTLKDNGPLYVYCLKLYVIQIVYFFHVFCMYSVLPSTDLAYSRVPGDQGGTFLFKQDFFWWSFYIQIGIVQFVSWIQTCPNLGKNVCNEFVCNQFVLVLLQIDIIQFVLYTLEYINL